MAAVTEKYVQGPIATLMGPELNALASSSAFATGAIASSTYFNTQGGGQGDGYTGGILELFVNGFAAAPAAGTCACVYFLLQADGLAQEDGSAGSVPARAPDAIVPFRAAAGFQRIAVVVEAPPGSFGVMLSQNSGQAFAATGNLLRWRPYTRQGV